MKAKDLKCDDEISLKIYGKVVAVAPTDDDRVEVTLGLFYDTRSLVFPDDGCVLKFTCPRGRLFNAWRPGVRPWHLDELDEAI